MNTFTKTLALALTILGFSSDTFAQVSANATATATIVTPIDISKTVDMNFGNVGVSATGGTVILAPAGTRTTTGGVVIPATTGTVTAASFNVTGQANFTYSISLPGSPITITRNSGVETMSVGTFTSSPTPTGTLSGTGAQTITVGATLTVGNNQEAGTYVSGTPFTVTVNYN
jgi:hypothetical protein